MMAGREQLEFKVGLSMTPGVTAELVRAMMEVEYDYADFFKPGMGDLLTRIGSDGKLHFDPVARQTALERGRREVDFMERHHVRALFLGDEDYPVLLRELHDAPVMLYVLGEADLDPRFALAIVGTRRATAYGTGFVDSLVKDLAVYYPDLLIVSGLAYGIDAAAHQAALKYELPTVAVVAHGMDRIYPAAHRNLAREIVAQGGAIVSQYHTGTEPYQRNFLERNRIIAGLTGATFVAESEIKGGAMSTANQAFVNNREVLALPGRVSDQISSGCNLLISREKAHLVTCAADVAQFTGWPPGVLKAVPKQRNLFPELQGVPGEIYAHLKHEARPMTVDELHQRVKVNMKDLMADLTEMEFDGIINKLPGARYELA